MGSRKCFRGFGESCDLSHPSRPPQRKKPKRWRGVKVDSRQRSVNSDKLSLGQNEAVRRFFRPLLHAIFRQKAHV